MGRLSPTSIGGNMERVILECSKCGEKSYYQGRDIMYAYRHAIGKYGWAPAGMDTWLCGSCNEVADRAVTQKREGGRDG